MRPAVFLDRDDVLIPPGDPGRDPAALRLIQGVASAIASLKGLGFLVVVASNEPQVAAGVLSEEDVQQLNQRVAELVAESSNSARIDGFLACPYDPQATVAAYRREHPDRKPGDGMFRRAAAALEIDLNRSWTVGHHETDIQAGRTAGTRTVRLSEPPLAEPGADYQARSLIEAVRIIAQKRNPENHEPPAEVAAVRKRWDAAAVARIQKAPASDKDGPVVTPEPSARPVITPARQLPESRRPFRPYHMPLEEEEPAPKAAPALFGRLFGRWTAAGESSEAHAEQETSAAASAAAPAPASEPVPAPAVAARKPAARKAPVAASPAPREKAAPDPAPDPVAPAAIQEEASVSRRPVRAGGDPLADTDRTLRQILQELRAQRGGDFSSRTIVAIALQAIAGICLIGGLWMGADDLGLFVRWIGVGVMVQLGAITLLLKHP